METMKKFYIIFLLLFCFTFTLFAQEEYYTGLIPATKDIIGKLAPFQESTLKGELKTAIDMSGDFPPVGNQGRQGSCVGFAIAYILSYYHHSPYVSYYTNEGKLDCSTIFSPAFIYNSLNNCQNTGISAGMALQLIGQNGIVTLCDMPYSESDYCTFPTKEQFTKAMDNRILGFHAMYGDYPIKVMKEKLNEGYPLLMGAGLDKNFLVKFMSKTETDYIWNGYEGEILAYHLMVIVGYDDNKNAFRIMNSWGSEWGEKGFFWISYDFIQSCLTELYYVEK